MKMGSEDDTSNLCEMKTFYKAPNFDVANYYGYVDSLIEKPYRIDSDYLIFKYTNDSQGNIKISDIWCKKVLWNEMKITDAKISVLQN